MSYLDASLKPLSKVVKSAQLPVKITTYLAGIGWLLCWAFLYRWRFLSKISLDWLRTFITQPSTLKLSDNPAYRPPVLFLQFKGFTFLPGTPLM